MFKNTATKIALFAFDTTTGAPKTGDAANLTAYVSKDYGTVTALGDTSATEMDATNAKGWYLFDVAQAEANADALLFTGKSTTANVSVVGQHIFTTPANFSSQSIDSNGRVDVIKIAGTTQTSGDIVGDTNDIQARLPAALVSGRMDSSVGAVAADAISAASIAADAGTEIGTAVWASATRLLTAGTNIVLAKGTGVTGFNDLSAAQVNAEADTAIADAALATATNLATVSAAAAAIQAKTDNLPSDPADESLLIAATDAIMARVGAPVGLSISADIAAVQAGVDAVPTNAELATALGTADDAVLAILGTPAGASLSADVAAVKTQTAAIEIDTGTDLPATLATIAAYVDTEVGAIKAKTDALPADPADASDVAAAVAAVKLYADRTVIRGTVSGTSPTTSTFTASALSPAGVDADQFKGRIIIFDNDTASTALRGQATDITANSAAALPLFTFSALTAAPQAGDTFSIV
jgi:hypothetical protein